jgi:hypothetical protein
MGLWVHPFKSDHPDFIRRNNDLLLQRRFFVFVRIKTIVPERTMSKLF